MTINPKLVIPLLVLPLLTGCSMNAPMDITVPVDVHDNTFNNGPGTGIPNGINGQTTIENPIDDVDPNAPQDIPDAWSEDSVDTPEPIPLPTPQG
jgi:hypothetical protein